MATRFTNYTFDYALTSGNTTNPPKKVFYKIPYIDTFEGSANPSWRDQVRNRKPATTPMTGTKTTITGSAATFQFSVIRRSDNVTINEVIHEVMPTGTPPNDDVAATLARCRDIASMRLAQAARKELMSVSGPQVLGELAQTLQMIRNPFKDAVGLFLAYVRFLRSSNLNALAPKARKKLVSKTYLEFVFGLQPLLMDLQGAFDGYIRATTRDKPRGTLTGFYSETIPVSSIVVNGKSAWTYARWSETRESSITVMAIAKGGLSVDLLASKGLAEKLKQETGFALSELIPTAWELFPFSFLVDYFINIGNLLSSSALIDGTLAWSQMTTRVERTFKVDINPNPAPALTNAYEWGTKVSTPGYFRRDTTTVQRTLGGTSVGIHFSLPSTKQVLNIAALLAALQGSQ